MLFLDIRREGEGKNKEYNSKLELHLRLIKGLAIIT